MNKYVINKLGFVNFWFYDFQEFELSDGKLLLRGSNGSGKSVTMQSFIPLVLDGNKRPSRLDPSGSNAKRLENYMLYDDIDERTSYLYIEFKNNDTYLTIGMGLKAEKGKHLDAWYFIINDGRRVNIDLLLYEETTEKIALSKIKLQNRVLPTSFFTTKQGDYMRKVNDLVFGYDNPDGYEDLLNLLIQVRAPKISKDFQPSILYEILKNSLKVLNDTDLRSMSESIQNMDNMVRRKNFLKSAIKTADNIQKKYDIYNKKILLNTASSFNSALQELKTIQSNEMKLQEKQLKTEEEYNSIQKSVNEKKIDLEIAEDKLKDFANSDIAKVMADIENIKSHIKISEKECSDLQKNADNQKDRLNSLIHDERSTVSKMDMLVHELEKFLKGAETLSQDIAFPHWNEVSIEHLKSLHNKNEISFYLESLKEYENRLKKGIIAIRERDNINLTVQKLEESTATKRDEKITTEQNIELTNAVLNDVKSELNIAIDNWYKANRILKLNKDDKLEIFKKINLINETKELPQITEMLHQYYSVIYHDIYQSLLTVQNKKQAILDKISKQEKEIETLTNTKEIEPVYSNAVINLKASLDKLNIPYIHFYKAFDFIDNSDTSINNILESAFNDMGLLDALIIDIKNKKTALTASKDENTGGKIIFCDTNNMQKKVKAFLKPENNTGIDTSILFELIQTIFSDDSASFVNCHGYYKHGILVGKGDPDYIAAYIGENSRKLFRENKISELNKCLTLSKQELSVINEEIEQIQNNLSKLDSEYKNKPSYQDIETAINELDTLVRQSNIITNDLSKLEEELYSAQQNYNKAKVTVTNLCKDIPLEKDVQIYDEALSDISRFKEIFADIRKHISDVINCEQILSDINISKSNSEQLIDEYIYKEHQLRIEIRSFQAKLLSKEKFIEEKETDDIKKEIERCTKIKQNYPKEIEEMIIKGATKRGIIKTNLETLKDIEQNRKIKEKEVQFKKTEFCTEAKNEFVLPFDTDDVERFSSNIVLTYKNDCPQATDHYYAALSSVVYNNSTELRENNISLCHESIPHDQDDASVFYVRSYLTCYLDGKQVPFGYLPKTLKTEFDETSIIIEDHERQLFEEFLLNTVSVQIRAKIVLSGIWVDKINSIMSSKGSAQRLELYLKWDPKDAENENELSIKELTKILQDEKAISNDNIKKLSKHFGSKIRKKIRESEDAGEHPNYQMIIRDILDYRQWYEFKLFANKDNEGMKELTYSRFNRLSVGERAMAMYIPLFAAVNARYDSADKKCPRIVCMDEAFAGISDNNKRILFTLLRDMDLEYILNSQELWGTYAEVDNLNIYELYREPSDKFVGISKFHWDGVRRKLC